MSASVSVSLFFVRAMIKRKNGVVSFDERGALRPSFEASQDGETQNCTNICTRAQTRAQKGRGEGGGLVEIDTRREEEEVGEAHGDILIWLDEVSIGLSGGRRGGGASVERKAYLACVCVCMSWYIKELDWEGGKGGRRSS